MSKISCLFALSIFLVSAPAAFAEDFFTCDLVKYYPDHNTSQVQGSLDAKITMSESASGITGRTEVVGHDPAIGFSEKVSLSSKAYIQNENKMLDLAIRGMGISGLVKSVDTYIFGAAGNRGAMVYIYGLKGNDGQVLDHLAFIWGAPGLGSCRTHAIVPFDLD